MTAAAGPSSPHSGAPDDTVDPTADLRRFLDASPTPYHACRSAAERLRANGFTELDETDRFPSEPGRHFLRRDGSLIAWDSRGGTRRFRVVGAHTDSPTLRIKPRPDVSRAGLQLLGVEVYGGPLLASWLDRDLGLAGRVVVRGEDGPRTELVHVAEPVLRVSQLAIHLDRSVNTEGVVLNPQQHLAPHWAFGDRPGSLAAFLAERVGVDVGDVLAHDLVTVDSVPAALIGRDRDLLASGRLDNLATAHAATTALIGAAAADPVDGLTTGAVLFDHEEVGSVSASGAGSTLLPAVLERIVLAAGGDRADLLAALAGTVIASGDMAHATHPNYAERHEPEHRISLDGGPVLKLNANQRYATDAPGAAVFRLACEQAGVPLQQFVTRTDLPCGSTVGPTTAALTGARTVDVGAAMLSMHSVREVAGARDQQRYRAALQAFLTPS